MRGRQSINPLTKFGFALIEKGILEITDLGKNLIASEKDSGDAFLKSFIKWQIPNPASNDYSDDGEYDVVPFVAMLKLISEVNSLWSSLGNEPVGISKREFCLFVPTLINYRDISRYASEIVKLRQAQKGKTKADRKAIRDDYKHRFAVSFLGSTVQGEIDTHLKNLHDYGDNAIRYFRLTKFIRIRGNGFYIDLEPSRHTEVESLFEAKFYIPREFIDKDEYLGYMSDDSQPHLPWQTKNKLSEISSEVYSDVRSLREALKLPVLGIKNVTEMSETELVAYVSELRALRKELQERDNHVKSQPVESVANYIEQLENIFTAENRPLRLEYLSTMGLHALNDAKEIKPNYPVGDDNEPTSTAPGGMADIECFYDDFNMICEVTMLSGRDQWYNEGQPVMRHLRDFEATNENSYCIFIAPTIHTDSAETFWIANVYGYKGSKQKIAPITISQFISILKTLKRIRELGGSFTRSHLQNLVRNIAESAESLKSSDEWVTGVEDILNDWSTALVK
ncbi:MAG TPA: AlwI family type II restriction endonuclease [Candidatus Saccharibacteria bacterium]|nr:AlwI family type II restriction endonuclease [Candidatus Saccharibacteria bacterium]